MHISCGFSQDSIPVLRRMGSVVYESGENLSTFTQVCNTLLLVSVAGCASRNGLVSLRERQGPLLKIARNPLISSQQY